MSFVDHFYKVAVNNNLYFDAQFTANTDKSQRVTLEKIIDKAQEVFASLKNPENPSSIDENFRQIYLLSTSLDTFTVRILVAIEERWWYPIAHFFGYEAKIPERFTALKKELEQYISNLQQQQELLQSLPQQQQELLQSLPIPYGLSRKSVDKGEPPNFHTISSDGTFKTINTFKLCAAILACCFHTVESKKEIKEVIRGSYIANNKKKYGERFQPSKGYNAFPRYLHNNLVYLHDALPGDDEAKKAKIYWSDRIEETLLPYFFDNEKADIDDLVFAITAGETVISPFQAAEMDFTVQLHFVGVGKAKIMNDLRADIVRLSQEIEEGNFLQLREYPAIETNPLMAAAYEFTRLNDIKNQINFLLLKQRNIKLRNNNLNGVL